tara:strand:+ start:676 stop:1515 length:840 start_codon:yes stop_codon:yes gene_type:complete
MLPLISSAATNAYLMAYQHQPTSMFHQPASPWNLLHQPRLLDVYSPSPFSPMRYGYGYRSPALTLEPFFDYSPRAVMRPLAALVDEAACTGWREAEGDKYELSMRFPGFSTDELSAELDEQHVTIRGKTSSPTRKEEASRRLTLPFAIKDPSALEIEHGGADGVVTLRLAKSAEAPPVQPTPLKIEAATVEPEKALADADPEVRKEQELAQLDAKFSDVVAAREAKLADTQLVDKTTELVEPVETFEPVETVEPAETAEPTQSADASDAEAAPVPEAAA